MALTFEGLGANNKWTRGETYSGKLTENITQATARDLLAEAMRRMEIAGLGIVGHVHDEVILEVPKGQYPDKICDQIADAIVTDCLQHDHNSRVAIECLFKNRCLVIAGELTSTHEPDYKALVQSVFDRINNGGAESTDAGFDYKLDFTADLKSGKRFTLEPADNIRLSVHRRLFVIEETEQDSIGILVHTDHAEKIVTNDVLIIVKLLIDIDRKQVVVVDNITVLRDNRLSYDFSLLSVIAHRACCDIPPKAHQKKKTRCQVYFCRSCHRVLHGGNLSCKAHTQRYEVHQR